MHILTSSSNKQTVQHRSAVATMNLVGQDIAEQSQCAKRDRHLRGTVGGISIAPGPWSLVRALQDVGCVRASG